MMELALPDTPHPLPWQEAPAAVLAGLRGVLTDIDDTLTREGRIEPQALEAIGRLHAAGWPVIAVTGRPAGWSEPGLRSWPVAAIVAENGGVLLRRQGRSTVTYQYTVDDRQRAERFARLQACATQVLQQVPHARLALDSPGRHTDIAIDHSEHHHLDRAGQEAVLAVMRSHGLTATVSSIHINGWLGEHDKWSGAQWAVQAVLNRPLEPGRWIYVGDSTNDEVMFRRLPASVGVANIAASLPRLRHRPAWITQAERGGGFAEVAERLLRARTAG
jgi:HAD superfamily hydrolase (TIGR01484 family)